MPENVIGKTLTIISPHQDDAALSLGAYIMSNNYSDIHIINCFTVSEYCPFAYASSRIEVMALRHEEDNAFVNLKRNSCIKITNLNEYDSPIRLNISNMDELLMTESLTEKDALHLFSLQKRLFPHISGTLLLPMGIEGHIDHIIACLAGLSFDNVHGNLLMFYLDVPYWLRTPLDKIQRRVQLIESLVGTLLYPHVCMSTSTWDKSILSEIYKSQITKQDALQVATAPFQGEVIFAPAKAKLDKLLLKAIKWTDLKH